MGAVHHEAKRLHLAFRLAQQPDRAHAFAIDLGGLLALPQVGEGGRAFGFHHPVGDAATCAAEVEAEHQAGAFRRAAVPVGEHQ